jgi:sigma-E factor negative regulatory protein RseC
MSQCKACVSLGGCRLSVFGRWGRPSASRLKIATERRFPVDSWLWIGLSRQGLLRSLVLLYFVPVLCLLVGGAVGCWFWPMLSGAAFVGQGPQWGVDAVTAVGMMLGLVLGVLLVRWQARAMHPLGITVLWPGESAEL